MKFLKVFCAVLSVLLVLQLFPAPREATSQLGDWVMSLYVRQHLTMSPDATTSTQSSEIYFYDTGQYIYAAADGQLDIVAQSVTFSSTVFGSDAFDTTATVDTVTVTGAAAGDVYIVCGEGASVDQQDVLQVEPTSTGFVVHRLASGASALAYNWIRLKTQ